MNSELSLLLRERHGWCYSVYTFFHGYPEKGIWGVYAGLMPSAYERVLELVTERLRWWQEGRLTSERLQRLKQQFLGRHAIVWERLSFRMQVQGRWLLDKGVPFDEPAWRAVLKALSVDRVVAAARESFLPMWVLALRPL
jgi:predicted Zn-dependent peptidase